MPYIEAQTTQGSTPQDSKLGAHSISLESLAQRRPHLVSIKGGPVTLVGSPLRLTSLSVLDRGAVGPSEEDELSVRRFENEKLRKPNRAFQIAAGLTGIGLAGVGAAAGSLTLDTHTASAQGLALNENFCPPDKQPEYVAGNAALFEHLGGDVMGIPVTCEHPDPKGTGDVHQQTTKGLLSWRKSTNTPTFTNGFDHWAIVPNEFAHWTGPSIDPPGFGGLPQGGGVEAQPGAAPGSEVAGTQSEEDLLLSVPISPDNPLPITDPAKPSLESSASCPDLTGNAYKYLKRVEWGPQNVTETEEKIKILGPQVFRDKVKEALTFIRNQPEFRQDIQYLGKVELFQQTPLPNQPADIVLPQVMLSFDKNGLPVPPFRAFEPEKQFGVMTDGTAIGMQYFTLDQELDAIRAKARVENPALCADQLDQSEGLNLALSAWQRAGAFVNNARFHQVVSDHILKMMTLLRDSFSNPQR